VDALIDFLLSSCTESSEGRVALVTHVTLGYAMQRLSDEQLLDVADGLTVFVDESHHLLASEQVRNVLGEQIARLLSLKARHFKLWLATAYFFRGDHLPIISETHLAEFTRIHIPFDEYWKLLKYIKTYNYDFIAFKGTVFKELEVVLKTDPQKPTIIYCPPEGHKMLVGRRKSPFVDRVEQVVCNCMRTEQWVSFDDAIQKTSVVVDLVDDEQRAEKLRFIAEHGRLVAAILTVGMFKEGADWEHAARIIDLVPSNSDQDRLQRFGRLVRDYPGKRHISYFSFFPFVVEQDEEERRKQLTKLYAHFHASLVLENAVQPIKVRLLPRPKYCPKDKDDNSKTHFNLLGAFSEREQEAIIRHSYDSLISLQAQKDEEGEIATPDEVRSTIIDTLKENGIQENLEPLAKQVLLLMRRKANITLRADELADAGFDKVWSTDIFRPVVTYSGGVGGPTTLNEIRDVVQGVFERKWQDQYEQIRNLAGPPDTQSPAYWWCTHNKTLFAQGKLADRKAQLLEQISWWTWTIGVADRWENNFETIRSMSGCPKAGTSEYAWVRQQRRFFQDQKLDQQKKELLESIPWWKWTSLASNWEDSFVQFAASPKPPERDTKLYGWMRTQRKEHRQGRLAPERVAKLESLPGWSWKERRSNRDDGIEALRGCINEGVEIGHTKSQVAARWAEIAGVGSDQVHKYLRNSDLSMRNQWKQLVDDRGRQRRKLK